MHLAPCSLNLRAPTFGDPRAENPKTLHPNSRCDAYSGSFVSTHCPDGALACLGEGGRTPVVAVVRVMWFMTSSVAYDVSTCWSFG